MVRVIAWPPVGVTGTEWTEDAPVQISRSMLTGAERVSAFQRKRRLATLIVPGFGRTTYDAGYIEMLKRYLEGINLVRLNSYPINWHIEANGNPALRQSRPLLWSAGGDPLEWESGSEPLLWFTGTYVTGTTATVDGRPVLYVTGLPPNMLVIRPAEFITLFSETGSETVQAVAPATTDDTGAATILLFEAPAESYTSARVNLGTCDTGVFRPVDYPRAVQPVRGDWSYTWSFREVFEDEVGEFEEFDPWRL